MSDITNPLFGKFEEVVDALVRADPSTDESVIPPMRLQVF